MPKQRREACVKLSHCSFCGEHMDQMACSIDWHAVYMSQAFKKFMIEHSRIPTQVELEDIEQKVGSDPCDDCCCGACGSRKRMPGQVCC